MENTKMLEVLGQLSSTLMSMENRITESMATMGERLTEIRDSLATDEVHHTVRKDGKQIEVGIRCNVMQMGDIDNVNQEFKAYLYVSARYMEPLLKGIREDKHVDWGNLWDPRINFVNSLNVEQLIKKAWIMEYDEANDCPWIQRSYRIRASFKEKLELKDFPFDFQELNVTLMSDWPAREVKFVKDMRIKDSINLGSFTASQTWDLQPYVLGRPVDINEQSGSHLKYPYYNITMHTGRHLGFYVWNIAVVMLVIMGLTFCSFAVPPTETGDRLAITTTLLLTSVAFKFIVSQNLPTISYLTALDLYVLMCMVMQVLITIQNAISSIWSDEASADTAKLFDLISGCALAGLVFIGHIVFIIVLAIKIRKRNRTMRNAHKEYDELCHMINEEFLRKKKQKANQIAPAAQQQQNKEPGYNNSAHQGSMNNHQEQEIPRMRHKQLDPIETVQRK